MDPVLAKKIGSGTLYLDRKGIYKTLLNEYLADFRCIPFCFHTFCVRRSIDALDLENKPGSGSAFTQSRSRALGVTEDVWQQKYEKPKRKLSGIFIL